MKDQSEKAGACRDLVHRFFEDPEMTPDELRKETRSLGFNIVRRFTLRPKDKQLKMFNEEKVNHEK